MLTKFNCEELLASGRRVGVTGVGMEISRLLLPETPRLASKGGNGATRLLQGQLSHFTERENLQGMATANNWSILSRLADGQNGSPGFNPQRKLQNALESQITLLCSGF